MISYKKFTADGVQKRFLSDFKIMSEQYARVYMYWHDVNLPDGADAPCGLKNRITDTPDPGEDLVTLDKWDLIDNSIAFYEAPCNGAKVYIEVATNPEEFGETLIPQSVLGAWLAASLSREAASRSEEAKDIAVEAESYAEHWEQHSFEWSSNPKIDQVDDGIRKGFSAYHWSEVAKYNASGIDFQGGWDPTSGSYPSAPPDGYEQGDWWIATAEGVGPDGRNWVIGDELLYIPASGTPYDPWVKRSGWVEWDRIINKPTEYPPEAHTHVIGELTDWPTVFPPEAHTHDDRYYTETEADSMFSLLGHTHTPADISPQGDNSTLDADMVDGHHASEFPLGSWSVDTNTATLYITIN